MRHTGFLLTLLLVPTLFVCCRKAPDSQTIRIGVTDGPAAVSTSLLSVQKSDLSGHEIELVVSDDPQQLQAQLTKGLIDFAVIPTEMAARLYNKGKICRMLACSIWGTYYLVSANPEIHTASDLQGATIAIPMKGSPADVLTGEFIRRENLDCRLDYRFTSDRQVAQALQEGLVTTAVLSEPQVSLLTADSGAIHPVGRLSAEGYAHLAHDGFAQSAFVVSHDFSQKHPDLVSSVCAAYRASCNFVNEHPRAVAVIMVEQGKASDQQAAMRSIELSHIDYVAAFAVVRQTHRFLQLMYADDPSTVGGRIPDSDFILHTGMDR